MFFAEVFSGASLLWLLSPWAILVTFPLYLSHLLLFVNLAYRTGRNSIRSLYLWGVIFGFYEFWITKVLWSGFNGEPMFGSFYGIAVGELFLLAFFWHPVMSFLAPIVAFRIFECSLDGEESCREDELIVKTRWRIVFLVYIALNGGVILAFNSGFNIFISTITSAISLAIIYGLVRICRRRNIKISMRDLYLGRKGMLLLVVYLAFLYLVAFYGIYPERIPPVHTIILTFLLYLAILLLIYLDKKPPRASNHGEILHVDDFNRVIKIFVVLQIVMCLIPPVCFVMMVTIILMDIILAITLLSKTIYDILVSLREVME